MTPLERTKERAVILREPIEVCYPTRNETSKLPIDFHKLIDKTYNYSSGVIAFIDDNVLYVIPFMEGLIETLEDEGFHQEDLYVPFTGFSYPVPEKERKKWEYLKNLAKK